MPYSSSTQDEPIPFPLGIKIKKENEFKGKVEVEGLYPGYGTTLGNALRRVLLSSLEGAAITEMKIKGVPHEFSTLPGVLEDVITIMLNLKKLRFKMIGRDPQTAILKVKGEKEVKGEDFELPPQLILVNKKQKIATLTSKSAKLEMEVKVEKGVGYLPVEEREKEKPPIGTILVDAIFSPIRKVGMRVENMRVGKRTDFEKLILDIETDGTISVEEAFKKAVKILISQLSFLIKEDETQEKEKKIS